MTSRQTTPPNANSAAQGLILVSVVIPARNCMDDLRCCLEAIRHSQGVNSEVIVVDDCSDDATGDTALQMHADRVIQMSERRGPAVARNHGVKVASADTIVFIDADVQVMPDTIRRLAERLQQGPWSAVFGSYCVRPTSPGLVSQFRNLLHHFFHQTSEQEAGTFWAGCGAVRREVFVGEGGFSESYTIPCIEDVEFGVRLRRNEHRILLDAAIQATHRKHWSLYGTLRTDILCRGIPWMRLLLEQGSLPNDLNIRVSQRLSVVLTAILILAVLIQSVFDPWAMLVLPCLTGLVLAGDFAAVRGGAGLGSLVVVTGLAGLLAWSTAVWPVMGSVILAGTAAIAVINREVFQLFAAVRNTMFSIACLPLLLAYYFCCGVSAAVALTQHWCSGTAGSLRGMLFASDARAGS